jgi:hypothetical protein
MLAVKRWLRTRFFIESGLGLASAVLFLLTFVKRDWIGTLFGVDPDHSSGVVEWLIVGGFLLTAVTLVSLAHYEWRRAACWFVRSTPGSF